jgi:hypothetical protein
VNGCSFFTPETYVGPGQIVELARPQKFVGVITDKKTKKKKKVIVNAQAGWFVGREKNE